MSTNFRKQIFSATKTNDPKKRGKTKDGEAIELKSGRPTSSTSAPSKPKSTSRALKKAQKDLKSVIKDKQKLLATAIYEKVTLQRSKLTESETKELQAIYTEVNKIDVKSSDAKGLIESSEKIRKLLERFHTITVNKINALLEKATDGQQKKDVVKSVKAEKGAHEAEMAEIITFEKRLKKHMQ